MKALLSVHHTSPDTVCNVEINRHPVSSKMGCSKYLNNLMEYITMCLDSTNKLEKQYVRHKNVYCLHLWATCFNLYTGHLQTLLYMCVYKSYARWDPIALTSLKHITYIKCLCLSREHTYRNPAENTKKHIKKQGTIRASTYDRSPYRIQHHLKENTAILIFTLIDIHKHCM